MVVKLPDNVELEWYVWNNGMCGMIVCDGMWGMVFVAWEERNGKNGIRRAGNAQYIEWGTLRILELDEIHDYGTMFIVYFLHKVDPRESIFAAPNLSEALSPLRLS